MPKITINGRACEFTPGEMIIQVANRAAIDIPQYCYHDGLSIVASCRICLGEIWAPNPKNNNTLEPLMGGKLVPTCQTACSDGWVVYTDSPRSVQNQKAVMEYLLINHPLDCPVCDQAGECSLQDYSYHYGRSASRFEETKVKNPKKDLGEHIYLYSDRCIMCTRCVRFTREVTGTSELMVQGRGNREEIDVFPGHGLANELSANVADLCPVGALLDKDFLFVQRVWFLKESPSVDGFTASGDNITVFHNEGKVYRFKPRTNMKVNRWWITDEVRYSWKHVHAEGDGGRLGGMGGGPTYKQYGVPVACDWVRGYEAALDGIKTAAAPGRKLMAVISPMLSCEDAFALGTAALAIDPQAVLAVGPVPTQGQDKVFPLGAKDGDPKAFKMYAEKAPNARGVRRVLEALAAKRAGAVLSFDQALGELAGGRVAGVLLSGNYPSEWATDALMQALDGKFVVLVDTLGANTGRLVQRADVVLPGATWLEKSGTFENARGMLQAFDQAIPVREGCKAEAQVGLDLAAIVNGGAGARAAIAPGAAGISADDAQGGPMSFEPEEIRALGGQGPRSDGAAYDGAALRRRMAGEFPSSLGMMTGAVAAADAKAQTEADMAIVEL
jgi:NADH-quinone oxidoreductase subunit G